MFCCRVPTGRAPPWTLLWLKGQWLPRLPSGPAMMRPSTSHGYNASPSYSIIFISFHHTHNSKRSTWWKPLSIVLLCIQFSFNCQVIPDELCGMGWPKSRDQVLKIFVIYIDILRHHCHHHRADNLDKVRFLVDQGIDHLVSLSPEKIPPAYAYPKYRLHHSKDCCMRIIILASLSSDQYNCHGIS